MEIKNYTECKYCDHEEVCKYKEIQEEVLIKMNGRLDNICCPDNFKFTFQCNFYDMSLCKKEENE